MDLSILETIVSGLDHPEGVVWAPDGRLYASGEAGQVYQISMSDSACRQIGSTGGFGLGIAADGNSNLYVCDMGVHAVIRVEPDGSSSVYSSGPPDNPMKVPNYPVFDADGNLYVSDSRNWGKSNGLIYRIDAVGRASVWSTSAPGYTNGMALSPDGNYLYAVESSPPRISRIAVLGDGRAGAVELVVDLPRTVPDGIAFDVTGNLYIACYAPDRIYRLAPGGQLDILFDDWSRMSLNAPTNLVFAGKELDRLVVASLGGSQLVGAEIGAKGSPLHHPIL